MELLTKTLDWLLGDTGHEDETPAAPAPPARDPAAGLRQVAERLGLARFDYRPG